MSNTNRFKKLENNENIQDRSDLWFCTLSSYLICTDIYFGVVTSNPEDYCITCAYCNINKEKINND